ncbi:GPI mannosyltransferase 2 [Trametes elegans]|nr:GPI mannosyltransferase 2 [Trametes elegans]
MAPANLTSATNIPTYHRRLLLITSSIATLLTLALTILASALPLFDASPNVLLPPASRRSLRHTLASAVLRWDAFHFAHIATHGYVYEHEWAFFPGVPFVMRQGGRLVRALSTPLAKSAGAQLGWDEVLLGGLLASVVNTFSVTTLYDLTLAHFRSTSIALLASLLSLLPSSPVTLRLAGYSEPFFTSLSYLGMLYCARKQWVRATCCFALATTFRSNGIFLCGFIAWGLVVEPFLQDRKVSLGRTLYASVLCATTLAFFVYHQYNAYRVFCGGKAATAPWCGAFLPSIYTYVQSRYWNVGFLRYWTVQQLPNFLLGAPPLALLFTFTVRYIRLALVPRLTALFRNGKRTPSPTPIGAPAPSVPESALSTLDASTTWDGERTPFLARTIAPHVIHALALTLLLLFASHTQIVLRQAASMPLTYWAAAWLLVERPAFGRLWVGWSLLWGAVSCVLWAVFLPPA